MDMTQYTGAAFITVDDVGNGPLQETIAKVALGNYDKPVLSFESGGQLSLNKTNVKTLIRAYGKDSRDWIGCRIEIAAGEIEYQGKITASVLVRPISEKKTPDLAKLTSKPDTRKGVDMDDAIPF